LNEALSKFNQPSLVPNYQGVAASLSQADSTLFNEKSSRISEVFFSFGNKKTNVAPGRKMMVKYLKGENAQK